MFKVSHNKIDKQNNNIQVFINKSTIKVNKFKKRLNIIDFSLFGPVLDNIDLVVSYDKPAREKNIPKIFYQLGMKFTFLGFCIKFSFL